MKTVNKKRTTKFFAALIALLIFAAYFSFVSVKGTTADAADSGTGYGIGVVDITNGNFEESESNYPASATGWSGDYITGTGGITHGVINLNPDNLLDSALRDDYKLVDEYNEYKHAIPRTHNTDSSNNKVLMINAERANAAYAYKSNTISLSKNSYYKISVWAKTSTDANACIKLEQPESGGLKNAVAFHNLNTFNYHGDNYAEINTSEIANYGWVQYSFHIETSTLSDTSVILSLQLGDTTTWTDKDDVEQKSSYRSNGYVLFDDVSVSQYTPDVFARLITDFNKETGKSNVFKSDDYRHFYTEYDAKEETNIYYSECDAVELSIKDGKLLGLSSETASTTQEYIDNNIGSFSNNTDRWEAAEGTYQGAIVNFGIRNNIDEKVGILEQGEIPYSPNGANNDILLISSYKNESYQSMSYGLSSPQFSITRHKFYKLSIWVKSINADSSNVVIRGENYKGKNIDTNKDQLYVSSGLTGLAAGVESRNGWTEVSFFLEGSSFADYKINIELWLGVGHINNGDINNDEQKVEGVAMFDNLRIEELTRTEFTNYSGSGTSVTFDAEVENSAGFTNADFAKVGNYTEYQYPLSPQGWTYQEVSNNTVKNASKDIVHADADKGIYAQEYWDSSIVKGIVPTDEDHFNENKANYGGLRVNPGSSDSVVSAFANGNNVLLLTSTKNVAVGYVSSAVSVTANTTARIDVNMKALGMTGQGANLVLKKGENVISTIEKIGITNNTSAWMTYSFYLEIGDNDIGDISVEIWLGLFDYYNNTTKLASGTIVLDSVSLTSHEAGDSAEFSSKYASYLSTGSADDMYGVYSFKQIDFLAFDRYEDGVLKTSYDYELTSSTDRLTTDFGVFDSAHIPSGNPYLWSGYSNDNASDYKYKLYLGNTIPSYTKVTDNFTHTIKGSTYYKLTFLIKVNIPSNQISNNVEYMGAYVGINSGENNYTINNIKNTAEIIDVHNPENGNNEYFRNYTVYIRGGEDAEDSNDFNIIFGIGGEAANQYCLGKLVIANISFESISDTDYANVKELIENPNTKESRTAKVVSFAPESETDEEKDTDTSSSVNNLSLGESWMVISSVMVAMVLIVAVIAFSVRYVARKRRAAAGSKSKDGAAYDRKSTLVVQHNKRAGAGESIAYSSDLYDEYDEEIEDRVRREALEAAEAAAEAEAKESAKDEETVKETAPEAAETEEAEVESESIEATDEGTEETVSGEVVDAEEETIAEEINYDEVIEFKAPKEFKVKKENVVTFEEAVQKAKVQKDIDDDAPVKRNTWDEFDD